MIKATVPCFIFLHLSVFINLNLSSDIQQDNFILLCLCLLCLCCLPSFDRNEMHLYCEYCLKNQITVLVDLDIFKQINTILKYSLKMQ